MFTYPTKANTAFFIVGFNQITLFLTWSTEYNNTPFVKKIIQEFSFDWLYHRICFCTEFIDACYFLSKFMPRCQSDFAIIAPGDVTPVITICMVSKVI